MIPLFVIAIVLSVAALAAEKSPRLRTRPHRVRAARALEDATVAHRACEVHLDAARAAADPATAVEHAQAAAVANQVAANQVAAIAEAAATEEQRVAAAQGAAAVVDRQHEIAGTLVDAHLDAASAAPDPMTAAEHVHEATKVNQVTAREAAEAAKAAADSAQRAEAAKSAEKVVEREKKIVAAWTKLGGGKCKAHTYENVSSAKRDAIIAELRRTGMRVTGSNPWDVDTNKSGVKLRAAWNPQTSQLRVIIADWGALAEFAGCDRVWSEIEPRLKAILK
jgi:hypothetical protein